MPRSFGAIIGGNEEQLEQFGPASQWASGRGVPAGYTVGGTGEPGTDRFRAKRPRNSERLRQSGPAGQPAAQVAAVMSLAPALPHAGTAAAGMTPSCVERPDSTTWSPWMSVAASRRALAAASRDRRFCSDRQLPAGSARSGLRSSRRARGQAGDVGWQGASIDPFRSGRPGLDQIRGFHLYPF